MKGWTGWSLPWWVFLPLIAWYTVHLHRGLKAGTLNEILLWAIALAFATLSAVGLDGLYRDFWLSRREKAKPTTSSTPATNGVPQVGYQYRCNGCSTMYDYTPLEARLGACENGAYYCELCRRTGKCGCA